jgi:hypothetical protein
LARPGELTPGSLKVVVVETSTVTVVGDELLPVVIVKLVGAVVLRAHRSID